MTWAGLDEKRLLRHVSRILCEPHCDSTSIWLCIPRWATAKFHFGKRLAGDLLPSHAVVVAEEIQELNAGMR
ncbi:hypothetical protein [Cupriavidus sp. BIS7]|uniref:hypothetical protein n=1 Tax=Cupriavidus sp. BIS7 TaxID=1217718 RepID=UPI0012F6B04E|nr:hypothetical protein [Cupriavidus sp. BIS7]